jgi:hypothetical protein
MVTGIGVDGDRGWTIEKTLPVSKHEHFVLEARIARWAEISSCHRR